MTAIEKIREKEALCECITEILEQQIRWQRETATRVSYRDEETGEWRERIKTEEEITDKNRATLAALDLIENALVKLI